MENYAQHIAQLLRMWEHTHSDSPQDSLAIVLTPDTLIASEVFRALRKQPGLRGKFLSSNEWRNDTDDLIAFARSGNAREVSLAGIHRRAGVLVILVQPSKLPPFVLAQAEAVTTGTHDLLLTIG